MKFDMAGLNYFGNNKKQDYETPKKFFDDLNKEFNFTVDVASSDENCLCKKHYTENENGLQQSWSGERVWCNPPYNNIAEWVKKANYEVNENDCQLVCMLIPSKTDVKWFHDFIYNKHEIRFIKGRLKFSNSKNSAPFPSMIVIFRKNE